MTMPPEADSAQQFATKNWHTIQNDRSRYFLPAPAIRLIEDYFARRQAQIENASLLGEFDWERDLYLARTIHRHNLDWLEKLNSEHQAYISYWKEICTNTSSAAEKISLAGLNTIYLVHGAVAVGALNALATKPAVNSASIAAAAKFAMPAALAGILLVAVGQIILARYGAEMASRVAGKLIGTVTQTRSRSLHRYWRKYHRLILSKSDYCIYGSIVWFFAYTMISYFILIN